MKKIFFHFLGIFMLLTWAKYNYAQNVIYGGSLSNALPIIPNPDALRIENGFISHRVSGIVGSFLAGDKWIGTGLVSLPTITPTTFLYGTRIQYDGSSLITSFREDNTANTRDALIEFGNNAVSPGTYDVEELKIRYFDITSSPGAAPSFDFMRFRRRPKNIVVGYNTANALGAEPKFAVYDGFNPNPASNPPLFSTGAVYGVTDGRDDANNALSYSAAVVGDVYNSASTLGRYGVLGIGPRTASTGYAGFFEGRTFSTGGYFSPSDSRLKKDIVKEESALSRLMQLRPTQYHFDTEKYNMMNLETRLQHGFIAQELEKIFPEMVITTNIPTAADPKTKKVTNPLSFKAVDYQQLHGIEVAAIQELQAQIQELRNQLAEKAGAVTVIAEDAADAKLKASSFMLAQNVPNPFTSGTVIKYSIPVNNTAMIAVMDLNGKMLLQFGNLKGSSQITINGNALNAGMYLYTLLVNGQELITKKMILTK